MTRRTVSPANEERWQRAVRLHADAAAQLIRSAAAVPPDQWSRPRVEGKWTPGQVVEHLTLAYEVLLRELEGGAGMRYRVGPVLRTIFRWTILPGLLRGGTFPRALSPREMRPTAALREQHEAIDAFQLCVVEFERVLQEARATRPRTRLTHAYFGPIGLVDGLTLVARHINHHRNQLNA